LFPEIEIGQLAIRTWDICLVLSYIVVVSLLLVNRPKDYLLTRLQLFTFTIIFFFVGLIGAGLLNILINIGEYSKMTPEELCSNVGSAYFGALILGLLGVWIFFREIGKPFLQAIDYIAPYLMLERVIGRIGCLLAGCCSGVKTNLPWGFDFSGCGFIVHPTQAYEMSYAFGIFISGIYFYQKFRDCKGISFFYVIFMYSFFRFFNEFLREEGPFITDTFKLVHPFLILLAVFSLFSIVTRLRSYPARKNLEIGRSIFVALAILLSGVAICLLISLPIISIIAKNN